MEYRFVREAGWRFPDDRTWLGSTRSTDEEGVPLSSWSTWRGGPRVRSGRPDPAAQVSPIARVGGALDYAMAIDCSPRRGLKTFCCAVTARLSTSPTWASPPRRTRRDITRSGTCRLGRYMAPEQLDGTGWEAGRRRVRPGSRAVRGPHRTAGTHGAHADGDRSGRERQTSARPSRPSPGAPAGAADALRRALDPISRAAAQRRRLASALSGAFERPEPTARTKRLVAPPPAPRERNRRGGLAVPAAITALALVAAGVGVVALASQDGGGSDRDAATTPGRRTVSVRRTPGRRGRRTRPLPPRPRRPRRRSPRRRSRLRWPPERAVPS